MTAFEEIIKWKACLVARGFQQIPGVDFFETYAGVVHYESLRMLWAICVNEPGWVMWVMDVVSAYLNSEMKEVVYMHQPEGFVVPGQEDKVCLIKRSLYGMMQSGRNWADPSGHGQLHNNRASTWCEVRVWHSRHTKERSP
jgi:hypothetical protein